MFFPTPDCLLRLFECEENRGDPQDFMSRRGEERLIPCERICARSTQYRVGGEITASTKKELWDHVERNCKRRARV
jgi:hypothetical protein